ncbi:MAG: hypothetical protein HEP71_15840 [Roseivirga sp.]|nr:hypothetical protein [Roseivirga sp.]
MINQEVVQLISWIPIGLIFIGGFSGIWRYASLGRIQKLLTWLLVIAFLTEIAPYFVEILSENTYPTFHVYAVLEYCLLALIFSNANAKTRLAPFLKISIPVMAIYALMNVLFWQPLTTPNTNVIIVSCIIMITLSVGFFFIALNRMAYQRIERSAMFWISIGVLIYFSSIFVMFTFLDWLISLHFENASSLFTLNTLLNIIHYLCFNIALWMKPE